jgi:GNAT superfamily N-acetyltransferase/nucleotide-binding universal stress UspA family protein
LLSGAALNWGSQHAISRIFPGDAGRGRRAGFRGHGGGQAVQIGANDEHQVILRDGAVITVRAIEPEDRHALAAGFEALSPESRYRRFFSGVSDLTGRQLDYLTRVDHHDHEALVALTDDGKVMGVARYVRTGPGEAEPAVAVADDWQGRGVGSVLLGALAERALDEGVTHFNAIVLAANPEAIAVLGRLGDASISRHGSELEMRIPLASPDRPATPLRVLLQAVANGTLDPALTFWQRIASRHPGNDQEHANLIVTAIHGDAAESAVTLTQSIASAAASEVVVVAARHPLLDDRLEVEQLARRVAARLRAHDIDVRDVVRAGDIAAVVIDVAIEERARLIIVAESSTPDATARLLGEPWNHISHHAPCSVLVAR